MTNLPSIPTLKMSSREIAELTGKRHDHVMADCRKMFEALNIQSPDFSGDYKDSKGRTYQEYLLDQDLTMTLVMGYSIPLRHKVAVRWRELEEKTGTYASNRTIDPVAALNDPVILRSTLLTYSEKVINLEGKIEEMKPAVERIAVDDDLTYAKSSSKILRGAQNAKTNSGNHTRQTCGFFVSLFLNMIGRVANKKLAREICPPTICGFERPITPMGQFKISNRT